MRRRWADPLIWIVAVALAVPPSLWLARLAIDLAVAIP